MPDTLNPSTPTDFTNVGRWQLFTSSRIIQAEQKKKILTCSVDMILYPPEDKTHK